MLGLGGLKKRIGRWGFIIAVLVSSVTFLFLCCFPAHSIRIGFWLPLLILAVLSVVIFLSSRRTPPQHLPRHHLGKLVLLFVVVLVLAFIVFPWFLTPHSVFLGVAVPLSIISFLIVLVLLGLVSKSLAILGVVTLFAIPMLSPWLVPLSYTNFFGGEEVRGVALEITTNEPNPELMASEMNSWVFKNMRDAWELGWGRRFALDPSLYVIPDSPYVWRRSNNPSEIIFYKYGACQEYAHLFVGLAREANLSSWYVHSPGEDHAWAEVEFDNSIKFFDPSNNISGNPSEYENMRGVQVSKVYAVYENEEIHDVTNRYTDTGKLTVHVIKEGEFVEDARVIVWNPSYPNNKDPVTENHTDNNGICVFELGGNDYLIRAEKNGYWSGHNVTLHENDNVDVILRLHLA